MFRYCLSVFPVESVNPSHIFMLSFSDFPPWKTTLANSLICTVLESGELNTCINLRQCIKISHYCYTEFA